MPLCNFCHHQAKQFAYYKWTRRYSQCQKCKSLERHRTVGLFFNKKKQDISFDHMLHFAPEGCLQKFFRQQCKPLTYECGDINPKKRKKLQIPPTKMDATRLQVSDNTYTLIYANHLLEHVLDDTKALREIYRVLQPGGSFITTIPQDLQRSTTYQFAEGKKKNPAEARALIKKWCGFRVYGLDFSFFLQEPGFEVTLNYSNCAHKENILRMACHHLEEVISPRDIKKYGLHTHVIYQCQKPELHIDKKFTSC